MCHRLHPFSHYIILFYLVHILCQYVEMGYLIKNILLTVDGLNSQSPYFFYFFFSENLSDVEKISHFECGFEFRADLVEM